MCGSEVQNRQQVVSADRQRDVVRAEPAVRRGDQRLRHLMEQHVTAACAGHRRVAEQRVWNSIEYATLIEQVCIPAGDGHGLVARGDAVP
jgi:hypothetical protein